MQCLFNPIVILKRVLMQQMTASRVFLKHKNIKDFGKLIEHYYLCCMYEASKVSKGTIQSRFTTKETSQILQKLLQKLFLSFLLIRFNDFNTYLLISTFFYKSFCINFASILIVCKHKVPQMNKHNRVERQKLIY